MIHRLQDGDVIKLIPRIVKGRIEWATKVDIINYSTERGVVSAYDPECKWASRIAYSTKGGSNESKILKSTKYYFNFLTIKGEIKSIAVGRTLMVIITENKHLMDLRSNWHLNIKVKNIQGYPAFDDSHPVELDWICPFDKNSGELWKEFIINNQPNLEEMFNTNSIYNNRLELTKYLGSDIIGDLISEDRNRKIDKLGI